jgi:GGDEF domain-containing protein
MHKMTCEEKIEFLKEQVKQYRFDYLTGLKQRFDFDHELRKKFKLNKEFWVCYYDVNHLHKTNREQGFAEGDRLIVQVACDIKHQNVPHSSYRTSGDEFYTICCQEPTNEVQNATMVCKNAKDFENTDALLKELDHLMIEAKTKLKTRRADD